MPFSSEEWEEHESRELDSEDLEEHGENRDYNDGRCPWRDANLNTLRYDQRSIDFVRAKPLEAGLAWIFLRNVILGFCATNYPYQRVGLLEYCPGVNGFNSRRTSSALTSLIMNLAGVCKMWRSVLRSKCVFRKFAWDFIPGSIEPIKNNVKIGH